MLMGYIWLAIAFGLFLMWILDKDDREGKK